MSVKNKVIKKKHIEEFLRTRLDRKGFKMNHPGKKDSNLDIVAQKDSILLHIVVMGMKEKKETRARDFYELVFNSFTHLEKQDLKYSIMALPIEIFEDLKKLIELRKSAWVRICIGFPEIRFYFVDLEQQKFIKKKLVEIINDEEDI